MQFDDWIIVEGARENNLKNIYVRIPRYALTVITGISGSGKSSLAFNTLYQEGQRRYFETFGLYTRQFIGDMYKPDVDTIQGLSPVIAIEQKNVINNPRSTVGTITEIYDFLRLLYARIATAYSPYTGKPMIKYSQEELLEKLFKIYKQQKILLLVPLVRSRKGHYAELFKSFFEKGYELCRVDGEIVEIHPRLKLDRYKIHDIELVIDRFTLEEKNLERLKNSLSQALKLGKGTIAIFHEEKQELKYFSKDYMCEDTGYSCPAPEPNNFSFNSPYGACPRCNGLGYIYDVDLKKLIPDPSKSIKKGGISPLGNYQNNYLFYIIDKILYYFNASLDDPIGELPQEAINSLLYGFEGMVNYFSPTSQVNHTIPIQFEGIINILKDESLKAEEARAKRWTNEYIQQIQCPECLGKRLKSENLIFKISGYEITEVSAWSLKKFFNWIQNLTQDLSHSQKLIAQEILNEVHKRTKLLLEIGLGYLSLDRPTSTLSGGESQRIRLASQLGSGLTNVIYILDEPSIGLHAADNHKLIKSLHNLRDLGNTIIVVEHDETMMRSADYIIDMGPGAGIKGGKIVGSGTPKEMLECNTLTCQYLSGKKCIPIPTKRRKPGKDWLIIEQAHGHNLKNIDLAIPLGLFVCVTGVSGSGKSSLIMETLVPALEQKLNHSSRKPLPFKSIKGIEKLKKLITIDQTPIGRTPRSNPATYTGVFDEIRKLFAQLPTSMAYGYKPGRFSFNIPGGRCEHCKGAGELTIEMNFLPDVHIICPVCNGKKYNDMTLSIRFKGKNIYDILNMTIEEATHFFENQPNIFPIVKTLNDVGLGYLRLGQPSTTLSGGEAQRVKLATELARKNHGNALYVLDEPTTGLHFEDIRVLLKLLNSLVEKGNTIIVIEHQMDVIAYADYIIDLGPEGGENGGYLIAQGTPEEICKRTESLTGIFLSEHLKSKKAKTFCYEQL
ncbi:MAG: excinuclease ABC subunit UvrA [Bacteroidales bacterium]|nr:excinuclease ABC subunit UvrA [Bacteroidales bacterium]